MDSLPPVLWMLVITIIAGRESFFHDICFFYRASLGGPDERREQKFATLVGDHFGMSPTNILLTQENRNKYMPHWTILLKTS
ncbi:hypothetical protein CWI35_08740 [[Bacillus] caldolyticus]|uniref:Uncharacterized protein n=2 Tax=Geobacillus thermoleovorans group TaxID=1505648 RepID=A0A2Z3N8W1_GEOTH|nr:hypothetical protein GT3921_17970 [Geobacillus thermocatenulatus]AUI36597.1 hypothetical protein CWI35_08740 [[Bacillus] caldolyticus]AWO74099.1 hypothetical protein C1N76_05755 [Geobacillus thermoleovorans]KLR75051.1 hypothetical protein ABH20_02380 [Geobacillus sp. T6]RAN23132.1 hypothetical protein VC88_07725 [Geobacillus sp. A8]